MYDVLMVFQDVFNVSSKDHDISLMVLELDSINQQLF